MLSQVTRVVSRVSSVPVAVATFALIISLAIIGIGRPAAEERFTIRMMSSPSGAGPYAAFSMIVGHIGEFTRNIDIEVLETQGANHHVRHMLRNPGDYEDTVFWTGTVVNWAAREGVEPFFSKPNPVMDEFRIIAVMGLTYNVWVTMEENIRTPQDFAGYRVGNGLLTQNEWGMHQRMLLDDWGLLDDLESFNILGPGQNISALLDGRVDVGTLFGMTDVREKLFVITGPHRELEASPRPWHYVTVPEEMITEYVEKTGAPFEVRRYPAGSLPDQPDELTTFGDLLVMAAHESFPEDAAYELVRMLIDNYDQIGKYSAFTRAWTSQTLAFTADRQPERFHPGALRAFEEAGLTGSQ